MTQFVGLDVAQQKTSVCVVDECGARLWEGSVRTLPDTLVAAIREHSSDQVRVGMETGPLTA
jgi:transposase